MYISNHVTADASTLCAPSYADATIQTDERISLHRFIQTDLIPDTTDIAVPPSVPKYTSASSTQTVVFASDVTITCSSSTQTTASTETPVPCVDLTGTPDTVIVPPVSMDPVPTQHHKIVQGINDSLSNFYPFTLHFEDNEYGSVEQCYQHIRAVRAKRPEVADAILKCASAKEAKALSKRIPRPDNRDPDVELMRQLLRTKAGQCTSFRAALVQSGNAVLVHSIHPSDRFWGSGLFPYQSPDLSKQLPGKNIFGSLLIELRPDVATIPYIPNVPPNYKDFGSYVVVLEDGETTVHPHRSTYSSPRIPPARRYAPDSPQSPTICHHCGIRGHVARVSD